MIYDREKIQVRTLHRAVDFTDRKVLEIGCGDGRISMHLAEGAGQYTAIDTDREKIRQAKTALEEIGDAGAGLTFTIGTGQDLEFISDTLDLVVFTLSLHHQESSRALDEAFRVLKPGGKALVLEPRVEGEFQQVFHLFNDETRALEQAREAVRLSRFTRVQDVKFRVQAEFEDLEDIYDYLFNLEGEARGTQEDRQRILNLLDTFGKTPETGPFSLKDELILFILEKP